MGKIAAGMRSIVMTAGLLVWMGATGQLWSAADKFAATFDVNNFLNNVGGAFGSFTGGTPPNVSEATASYTSVLSEVREGSFAEKIIFNNNTAFSGFWMKLGPSTNTPLNVSNQTYYSFWVKGAVGGEKFKMELKDLDTTAALQIANISGFQNGISASYQNVVVRLSSFTSAAPGLDLTALQELTIVFEYPTISSGTIYMDDFRFISNATPEAYPNTPTLTDPQSPPNVDRNGVFDLDWTDTTNTTAYEIWTSTDSSLPAGADHVEVSWLTGSATNSFLYAKELTSDGTYYNKVRGWTALPENDGASGPWSNTEDINVTLSIAPSSPVLTDPGSVARNSSFALNWSDVSNTGAFIYEVQEASSSSFSSISRYSYPTANTDIVYITQDNTSFYYRVRAYDGLPHPSGDGRTGPFSNTVDIYIDITTGTFKFEDVKQIAFNMSQVAYSSPQKTNEPQLDWPEDSNPNSIGLVFEETNQIKGDKAIDDGDWIVELRPRAGIDPRGSPHKLEEVVEDVWVNNSNTNDYILRIFDKNNYNYAHPKIVPPIDFNAVSASTSNWQYNIATWLIHKATFTNSVKGYPIVSLFEATAYSRHTGYPPLRLGSSPRWFIIGKDRNFGNSERFPILRRQWIKKVSSETINVMGIVDVEAFTAAISVDVKPNFNETRYDVTSVIYPRRTIFASEQLGFGGFSSLFRNESGQNGEAHDHDTLIVKYTDNKATEKRPVHFDAGTEETIYYTTNSANARTSGYAIAQEDTYNPHYIRSGDARYSFRTSYSNDLSTASKPVRVRHFHFAPTDEFADNTVNTFEFDVELPTAASLASGVTAQWTWKSYFASAILEDAEDNDISPRVTYWNNLPIVNFNGYNVATSTEQKRGGEKSLKATWNKNNAWDYFNFAVPAGDQSYNRQFERVDGISFWVYGSNVPILIKLKDGSGVESSDIATLNATSTSTWTKLTYRFDWIKGGTINMNNITDILVFVDPGVSPSNGTIYMDDFEVEYIHNGITGSKGIPLLIDSAEDGDVTPSGKDGLDWSDETGSNYAYTAPTDRASDGTRSLKIVYTKTSTSTYLRGTIDIDEFPELENWMDFSAIQMDVSEAVNEDVDIMVNMSTHTNIQNNELYLLDVETVVNKSGAEESQFQTLTFDFSDVKPAQFGYAFEKVQILRINVEPFCSNCTGTIYIDNIRVLPLESPRIFDDFEDKTVTEYPSGLRWGDLDGGSIYSYSASTENPFVLGGSTTSLKVTYNKSSQYQFFYSDIDALRQSELKDWSKNDAFKVPIRGSVKLLAKLADSNDTLKAVWNVGSANQVAGMGWTFASNDRNVSSYTYVRVWVRGDAGGETFRVGLKDAPGTEKFVLSSAYASVVSGGFTKFDIPLSDFSGIQLSSMNNVSISFTNSSTTASGTVYIDDVRFLNSSGYRVMEDFNDGNPDNADGFGGTKFEWSENGGSITTSISNFSIEQDVATLESTKSDGYATLEFNYSPLGSNTNINLTNIKRILYDINPHLGSSSGTVYFDDITFKPK